MNNNSVGDSVLKNFFEMEKEELNVISITENVVDKKMYNRFVKVVSKLYDFLHIFKSDLQSIEIDKKEDHDFCICSLIMIYTSYKIHAEFESTGIKKLIKLCALLEYLMEYGKGWLCFTTHNVGPMDILKQHKKSIDL